MLQVCHFASAFALSRFGRTPYPPKLAEQA
jgi:hypothetical protein